MPLGDESFGVVIAGVASLRGKDLKQYAQERGFPAGEIRLIDDELAAGTLTDLGGEPAIIQPTDASSFDHMRFVFFTGSARFSTLHEAAARRAGAMVIDLSGALGTFPGARPWIPRLDPLLPVPSIGESQAGGGLFISPSTPAIVATSLSAAWSGLSLTRLVIVFFVPVSERGQAGIDELEYQTTKLLSLQPMSQDVFATQVAFNLLDRWGAESGERLVDRRSALEREVHGYLYGRAAVPAMTLIQAPVFYGNAFSIYAEFAAAQNEDLLAEKLKAAGFAVTGDSDLAPSPISAAGEAHPLIGRPRRDPNVECGYWAWGAADNLRLASANAIRIAETLLAT